METLRIGTTDVILQDFEVGQGKLIISDDDYGYNFSYYWGSMGKDTDLSKFLTECNTSYFTMKLGPTDSGPIDSKRTIRNVRTHIREEMCLNWYEHMEFQKDMRERLKDFERKIYSQEHFVHEWDNFVKYSLDYYLIEDKYDRDSIEQEFNGICEPWHFIETEEHRENIWLNKFHKKLVKELKKSLVV